MPHPGHPGNTPGSTETHLPKYFPRKNFDDRAQTALARRLRTRTPVALQHHTLDQLQDNLHNTQKSRHVINWSETSLITRTLNAAPFLSKFGAPTAIELSPTHIWVGTRLGRVAAFTYRQNLDFVLELSAETQTQTHLNTAHAASAASAAPTTSTASPVTCMAVSSNGLFVCAGLANGSVVVWEIPRNPNKSPSPDILYPFETIRSLSLSERAASSDVVGHLYGVPVNTISFVGDSHQNLVSSDISGLVLFHHGFQKLFRKRFVSQRLLGYHVASSADLSDRFCVHDCSVLPIGTAPQLTDHIGVLAVITSNILVVLSICSLNNDSTSYPKTHFKITRPKNVSVDFNNAPLGCLTWYPSIKTKNTGGLASKNAKLAYSWNNVLTILELDNSRIPENAMAILADLKDKDRAIPELQMFKTARWNAPDPNQKILSLKWLNSEILTALIQDTAAPETDTKLHFFYYRNDEDLCVLQLVGSDDIESQQVSQMDLSGDSADLGLRFFNSSLRIFRHRPVVLVDSHSPCLKSLLTGSTSKWADRLMGLITAKDFMSALLSAYDFYCSENTGQLLLSGLPHTTNERHEVVEPFLLDIMRESVDSIFGTPQKSLDLKDSLWLYFHITGMITSDRGGVTKDDLLEILDRVHEVISDYGLFFEILEKFILAREIRTLPPSVFKNLVETYVEAERGDLLTEIICILDTRTLNIDLTLKLCEAHGLRECLAYIWNVLLKDYTRPFIKLIADMDSEEYIHEQKILVYTYMSYILSGRQFPTDDYLSMNEEEIARAAICKVLFGLREIDCDATREFRLSLQTNTVFPYLYKFLKFDAFETLATLNEFFENPCLNTEGKGELNRQYIIEALIDIFRENRDAFSVRDRVHLAIFVARNYPKYFQFIRISDSILEETVEMLCNSPKECHDDAELALESLLPVYDVKNEEFFQERIKAAKFYRVAFGLNRSMQRFSNALEIWLEQQRDTNAIDLHTNFTAFVDIVSNTFGRKGTSQAEQTRLFHIIEDNFEELVSRYPQDMVILANSYNASMHRIVLRCQDEKLAFEYLKTLFEDSEFPNFGTSKIVLLIKFISLSCEFARKKVCDLVDIHSHELVRYPTEYEGLLEKLRAERCFEALAVLSRNLGKYEQAIQVLGDGCKSVSEEGEWTSLESLVSIGISVCEKDKGCWGRLVQILVGLKSPKESDTTLPDSVNQSIYRCFRKIIDRGEKEQNPHFFTEILQGVMDEATLSHVREVLQETLTSFYFDSEIHNITLGKLNGRIRKHMEHARLDCLRGWILKDKECASCGKPMWGDDVSNRHREAWENREKAKAFDEVEFDKQEFTDCELVLFKCTHAYHSHCLERLGSAGRCVICTQ
ncbi:hypothetical protein JCM33374_g4111 [Metschnikowia sp. JCM 33374]|nr:hypothetical protein JCM33374_g4111 [Metschnikowia sp. JCM 33374]